MPTEEEIIDVLKKVVDPHTGTDVYSMGLISDLVVKDDSVSLTFTPTTPFCPMGIQLAVKIKENLSSMEDLTEDDVYVTIDGHINQDAINEKLAPQGE
ncbi:MAG: metal-sulfur cluster assembly factor [Thermoplasmatota archaeon]